MRRHYAALLRRAASLPSLPLVASLHAAALRRSAVLVPSLIYAYSACGDLASARNLFDELPAQERSLSARTALASAMSAHGRCQEVLDLFRGREGEMDDKAVTVVLAACARAGMVDEGRGVFAMVWRPALQHYTCMVEMLGRAGQVEEAEALVARMEARPDRVICAVLLAACRVHGRVDVAERVASVNVTKEVPPLDLGELFAYFLKQSEPLFDQLGTKRDVCNKLVQSLCSKRKDHLGYNLLPTSEPSSFRNDSVGDELDLRIASVLQSTGHHYEGGFWNDGQKYEAADKRHVAIVTTASLPWMTGTAVNPLFRAAYLSKSSKQDVTLVVPWLCKSDQGLVYPNSMTFSSPQEQEAYMRNWLEERVGFKTDFKISFYPRKFQKERRSITPAGDTSQFIPSKEADIAILEEPEHLNWYHHGKRWTDKFNHVVGVVHTNYLEYIKREKNGAIQAFFVKHINNLVARACCHKVLRLSGATQDLPKFIICNVHGVNPKFLEVGERIAAERASGQQSFSNGGYFIGKMVWAKGYRELIDLFVKHKGEDSHEVQSAAKMLDLNRKFHKGRDHTDDSLHGYKVFINPSISDVLCTATAEALAMGKFVVYADHPSNDFFRSFPNCLTYKTSEDFFAKVKEAMTRDPQPLTPEQRYDLSWEDATQRFMEHSELDKILSNNSDCASTTGCAKSIDKKIKKSASVPNMSDVVDGGLALAHYCFTGNELLRLLTGALPGTLNYNKQHSLDLHLLPPQVL